MKNKYFYIKVINLLAILLVITAYQGIVTAREKDEQLTEITKELEVANLTIGNVKEQVQDLAQENAQVTEEKPQDIAADKGGGSDTESTNKNSTDTESTNNENINKDNLNKESTNKVTDSTNYQDGVYTGEADGFGGKIAVEVTIQDAKIANIEVVKAKNEDASYLVMAKNIIKEILDQQTTQVDTISGATFSSKGIKDAVANALHEAVKE